MMDSFRQSLIDYVLSGHAYLHAHTPEKTRFVQELTEFAAELPAEFLGGGNTIICSAFNPVYLLDALKTLGSDAIVIDIDQNGYGCDGKVFGKPVLIYNRYDAAVRWVFMPVNAGLEASWENLGSNYPEHLEEEENSSETEVA